MNSNTDNQVVAIMQATGISAMYAGQLLRLYGSAEEAIAEYRNISCVATGMES